MLLCSSKKSGCRVRKRSLLRDLRSEEGWHKKELGCRYARVQDMEKTMISIVVVSRGGGVR